MTIRRPSLPTVLAGLALFVALGGPAAASSLISGSSIRRNSIPADRIRAHSLTGTQINLNRLGTVPSAISARNASHATTADSAIRAGSATTAGTAGSATHAASADSATHATSADSATHAGSADSATEAGSVGGIPAASLLQTTFVRTGHVDASCQIPTVPVKPCFILSEDKLGLHLLNAGSGISSDGRITFANGRSDGDSLTIDEHNSATTTTITAGGGAGGQAVIDPGSDKQVDALVWDNAHPERVDHVQCGTGTTTAITENVCYVTSY